MPTRAVRAPEMVELETLVTCAAEGSLSAAARKLGVSRPAVAKRVAHLEALAGRRLLNRNGRGVVLTEHGAVLLAGARGVLDERDVLMGVLAQMRGDSRPRLDGLRELLGHAPESSRAAQRPEARLIETERLLELVLTGSSTGVVISDPDTAVVLEVNEAFCRFAGRRREQLVGQTATEIGTWYDPKERDAMIESVRRSGVAERVLVRTAWPDGEIRSGEATARFVSVSGRMVLLTTVEDVTERRRLDVELGGTRAAYRAIAKLCATLGRGESLLVGVERILPELRALGGFATAMIWDGREGRTAAVDGVEDVGGLKAALEVAEPVDGGAATRFGLTREGETCAGWAVPLTPDGHVLVLISPKRLQPATQKLVAGLLDDLTDVARAIADP